MKTLKSKISNLPSPKLMNPAVGPQTASSISELMKSASRHTEICFAPILRERKLFTGHKISLSWISYRDYINYRRTFDSTEAFFERSETFSLVINVLGDCEYWDIASELLSNSTFFLERNMNAKLIRFGFDDGFSQWVTI